MTTDPTSGAPTPSKLLLPLTFDGFIIRDANEAPIADVRSQGILLNSCRKDFGARIVHCVNTHAALESQIAELRAALEAGSPEDGHCARCGRPVSTRPDCEPTPECDDCAHAILATARAALGRGT